MRILHADDHRLLREGLKPFLYELAEAVEVVGVNDFGGAEIAAREAPFDLVLLDLLMPGMTVVSGLERMHELLPGIPVVILSGSVDPHDVRLAVDHGAAAYLPKTMSSAALLNALKLVLAGERHFPSFAFGGGEGAATEFVNAGAKPQPELTERERTIIRMMAEGATNKEIARVLSLEEITIKVHTRRLYRRLGAANRAEAVRLAVEQGLYRRRDSG